MQSLSGVFVLKFVCAKKGKLPAMKLKMEGKEHLKPKEGNDLKSM